MSSSCLGRACTVQHRNPDCRGGKNYEDHLRDTVANLRQENRALKRKAGNWQRAAEALEAAMNYQDTDWLDPVLQNDLDRDAMELLQIARESK